MTETSADYDFDKFRAWLHGIVVVTFDLELGQVIENVYPITNNTPQVRKFCMIFSRTKHIYFLDP